MPDSTTFQWDETLYRGSAEHYSVGRMPYPPALAEAIRNVLDLDGRGRLLDVGCGPGSLTLLLAPEFEAVVAVDADAGMLDEGRVRAEDAGLTNITWCRSRAEDLPDDLGRFRAVTFAQSFHWMNQVRVARRVRDVLEPDGRWVHIGATTHRGDVTDVDMPHVEPPWERIDALVARYLGPQRRAGQGFAGEPQDAEALSMRAAGYELVDQREVSGGPPVDRTIEQVLAAVLSLSYSAPHLFKDRLDDYVTDLRATLTEATPDGVFSEKMRDIEVLVWSPGN